MGSKKWYETFNTYIWVFNTGRGLSICIRLPHNIGLIYDAGSSKDFSPVEFIAKHIAPKLAKQNSHSIAQCFLSHPHADHIWEVGKLFDNDKEKAILDLHLLTCPNDKCEGEKVDFSRIINDDNRELIGIYRSSYEKRNPPLQTLISDKPIEIPNVEYGFYYMLPERVGVLHNDSDHDYGNGLSIACYLRHGKNSILIPGDITPAVMKELLLGGNYIAKRYTYFSNAPSNLPADFNSHTSTQPILKDLLGSRGLTVLVAPHHGLESCYSTELFDAMKDKKPRINIISEKRHASETDGTVDQRYQKQDGAIGVPVDVEGKKENRFSASTRDGHHILIVLTGTEDRPYIFLRNNPEDLLEIP